jgi:hypothetical protein
MSVIMDIIITTTMSVITDIIITTPMRSLQAGALKP